MAFTLAQFKVDFDAVNDGDAVIALQKKYGFTDKGVPQLARDNLGTEGALIEGSTLRLAYRWYDPSGAFQNLPDIHRLRLEINGKVEGERSFEDS